MVQSIGPKPISASDRPITSIARVSSAATVASRGDDLHAAPQLSSVAHDAAQQPPIDSARVAELRKAVRDGTYQIDPDRIADRMLALKQEWTSK